MTENMNTTTAASFAFENQSVSLKDMYRRTEFASAITLVILSPVTVLTNILLLTAIFKDPLSYFKRPSKYFVVGLSVADLLCGFVVEPFFAMQYFGLYLEASREFQAISQTLFAIGSSIANITLNASFMMVLMLSVVHYIAVEYPHRYKTWVRQKTVLVCVLTTWIYFILFSFLPLTGVKQELFFKINLTVHSTLISLVLILVQFSTFRACRRRRLLHKKQAMHSISTSHSESQEGSGRKLKQPAKRNIRARSFDKHLFVMTFYLAAILLFSALPHIVVFYIFLYKEIESREEEMYLNILLRVTDLLLFAKIAADAFIFAWRLPTYRKSLGFILTGKMADFATAV